jgi:hypothetical protein
MQPGPRRSTRTETLAAGAVGRDVVAQILADTASVAPRGIAPGMPHEVQNQRTPVQLAWTDAASLATANTHFLYASTNCIFAGDRAWQKWK